MGKIRVLSEEAINQIAAGEVIESPASVVKELVENSLDSGASRVWIEVRGGGFQLIRVADDGSGMSRDDAILCFERHATSKIAQIEDLNSLHSMGFRGEALASIAAVSKMQMVTAEEGKDAAEVEVEGGSIRGARAASRAKGTTIEVRSLFYNVPARKKFQKSAQAATVEIHKLLLSLALAHPEVGFEIVLGETAQINVPPEGNASLLVNLENRIEHLYRDSFLQSRKPLFIEKEGYLIQGFLGSAADDRINRSGQHLFINRRKVISPGVSAAIKAGYGHRIDERRYPTFVLHLFVPPSHLDVNVHPQKREVRFQNEGWLKDFLQTAAQSVFQGSYSSPICFSETSAMSFQEAPLQFKEEETTSSWMENPEVIGLFGYYLLLDASTIAGKGEGIVWVHLQKAQEKILLKEMENFEGRSQGLLIPLPLMLTKEESLDLDQRQNLLQKMGFSVELSGKESFLIHAIPPFIEPKDAADAIKLILQGEPLKKLAAFAVRGKKRFMIQEALALWKQVKDSLDPEIIAKTGPDAIEDLFR